jgi:hypothetical protein
MHADIIKEEFLFCEPLLDDTKASTSWKRLKSLFPKQKFDWQENLHTLRTDVAPVNTCGFAALLKKEAPHMVVTRCFLHRHALATKSLAASLKEVLSTAINVINSNRPRPKSHF